MITNKGDNVVYVPTDSVVVSWLKKDRKYIVDVSRRGYYLERQNLDSTDLVHDIKVMLRKIKHHTGDYLMAPGFQQNSTRFIDDDSVHMRTFVAPIKVTAKAMPNYGFKICVYSDYDEHHDSALSMKRAQKFQKVLVDSGISPKRITVFYTKFVPYVVQDDPDFPDDTPLTDDYVKKLSGAKRKKADAYNRRTSVSFYIVPK
jgi:hypothetical protein